MAPEEWRLGQVEKRVDKLEARNDDIAVNTNEIRNIWKELHDLSEEVKALRRALYTAALSVAGGAVLFALTLLQVFR